LGHSVYIFLLSMYF